MNRPTVAYDRCPHCSADIRVHLQRQWDYQGEFDIECPKCGKGIGVIVETVPEFRCSSETNESRERDE